MVAKTLLVILLIATFSIHAKPAKGKATRGPGPLYSAELQLDESVSPRGMEEKIILSRDVQSCLREAVLKSGDDFSVSFSGQLSAKGEVTEVQVEHSYPPLGGCLNNALTGLNYGPGAAGPFKIEISRVRTTPAKSKTFLLDLNDSKKLQ